jgi:hypothetical protein
VSTTYVAPNIGPQGLTVPTYQAYLNYLVTQFQNIFGATVYLGNDSADYQDIVIRALLLSDIANAFQLVFNNQSPVFAIGVGLDIIVKLNGLTRKLASYSTVPVICGGTAGTVITNGVVQDVNNNLWNLASPVTIGGSGTVTVTATAQVAGPIDAQPQTFLIVGGATAGWVSATSNTASSDGTPVETDAQLRARQAVSTQEPSVSLVTGTYSDLLAVPGVTRVIIDENTTSSPDTYGTPGHTIQCVVENGEASVIATTIYDNKSIGCGTYGSNIATIAIDAAGSGYDVGDALTVIQSGASGGTVTVTTVGGSGNITGISLTTAGIGYSDAAGLSTSGGHGTLATVTISALGQAVSVVDPVTGVTTVIQFSRPSYTVVYVKLGIHQLSSWNSSYTALIQQAVVNYLNGLAISNGTTVVSFIALLAAAMSVNASLETPAYIIEIASSGIGTSPSPSGTSDITLNFGVAASGSLTNVTVNFV